MVWHQFSTVQFTSHQLVWKVHSVQFRAWGPFSSGPIRSIEPSVVWEEQKKNSRSPTAEIPAYRSGVCRFGGRKAVVAGCACLLVWDVVWCQSDANSVQDRLTKVRSVQFACLIGTNSFVRDAYLLPRKLVTQSRD